MSPAFSCLLARLDYRAFARIGAAPRTAVESYLVARSHIILGEYDRAEARLGELSDGFAARFLSTQLRIFRRQDLPQCHLDLYGLLGQVPNEDYWLAEYHIIGGYLSQLLDEYTLAARHQRLAVEHYRRAGLAGCEAVALYNLAVCHDHLNQRDELREAFARLETIAADSNVPAVELFWRRMRANLAIDREDYPAAAEELARAAALCRVTARWRDLGSVSCVQAYLALKLSRPLSPVAEGERFLPEHRLVLRELAALAARALLPAAGAQSRLAEWRRRKLDSVFYFLLADVLLERVWRAQGYEWVLATARQIGQLSLRKQQALSLLDFRHYEIASLIKLGRFARAEVLWNAYRHDAIESGVAARIEKARALEPLLRRQPTESVAGELVVDTGLHQVSWRGRRSSLVGKPMIERLLVALIGNGPLPLPALFHMLYGGEYHPLLHGRRLHSLIDRTRRLLGSSSVLVRREGRLALAADCLARVEHTRAAAGGPERRRRLLQLIRQSPVPISLSDISTGLDWSRRTLQLDLGALLRAGEIGARGRTRKRLYFAEEK